MNRVDILGILLSRLSVCVPLRSNRVWICPTWGRHIPANFGAEMAVRLDGSELIAARDRGPRPRRPLLPITRWWTLAAGCLVRRPRSQLERHSNDACRQHQGTDGCAEGENPLWNPEVEWHRRSQIGSVCTHNDDTDHVSSAILISSRGGIETGGRG